MKIARRFAVCFALVLVSGLAQAKTALIFGGNGTENDDPTGSLNGAIYVAKLAGFDVKVVTSQMVTPELLQQASIWIQPGGPNFEQAYDMQASGVFQQVRDFVAAGGGYVGFCGGGYMAQSYGSLGLGLLPGMAQQQGEYTHKTEVLWQGKTRYVHIEHGPRFERRPGIEVVATYAWNSAPAAVRGKYGKGRVFLSGPHPEALSDWEPVEDPDGPDFDLALEMINYVVNWPHPVAIQSKLSLR